MNEYLTDCKEYEPNNGHGNLTLVEDGMADVCGMIPGSYPYRPSVHPLRMGTTLYLILRRLQPYWRYGRVREIGTGSPSLEFHVSGQDTRELQDEGPKNCFQFENEHVSVLSLWENNCYDVCAFG